jgi:2,3-bisphosphoglycerate-dependent phosphoglycerate mutase
VTGTLILLRHGESTWNREGLFTGWVDCALSEKGREEAVAAGEALANEDFAPDVLHTSVLKRAIHSANIALEVLDRDWIPVRRSWRLNERHYGALQGLNKKETTAEHGEDKVKVWRRSYDVRPPPLPPDDEMQPRFDPRYADVPVELLPASECLADVVARMQPYWDDDIVPDLQAGRTTLVAAHGNSLRALVKKLDGISDEAIAEVNIPTGVPRVYRFDDDMQVVGEGRYLGDAAAIEAATEAVARQAG